MINIALEEGTYYKKQDWCWDNSYKYLVESDPHKWNTTFLSAMEKFGQLDYIQDQDRQLEWNKFSSIAAFFKNLKHPQLTRQPSPQQIAEIKRKSELSEKKATKRDWWTLAEMQKEMNKSISKMKVPSEATDYRQSLSRRQFEPDPPSKREYTREQAPSVSRQPLRLARRLEPLSPSKYE